MREWWRRLTPEQRREKIAARDAVKVREQDRVKQARRRKEGTAEQQLKIAARNEVRKARLRGDLVPQQCEAEGCNKIGHAHHDDYRKPLEVRWLCRGHHDELHQNDGGPPEGGPHTATPSNA